MNHVSFAAANHGPGKHRQDHRLRQEDLQRERGIVETAGSAAGVELRQRTSTVELSLSLVDTVYLL